MNNYINSTNIKMYPSALRGGVTSGSSETIYDPESRLSTEKNLTNAVNNVTVTGSFVKSYESNILEFSIHGYCFTLSDVSTCINTLEASSNLYANIKLKDISQSSYTLKSLVAFNDDTLTNLDSQALFYGIKFSETAESGAGVYSLHLLTKTSGTWTVPKTSWLKINGKSISVEDTITNTSTPLSDIIYKDNNNKLTVDVEEFKGHLTGNVTGDVLGNASTATNASAANKLNSNAGSSINPIYFANGIPVASNATAGGYGTGTGFKKFTSVSLNSGTVTAGQTIYYSPNSPGSQSVSGVTPQEGDVWVQYFD